MNYSKIFKVVLLVLFIVGAVLSCYGFFVGWEDADSAPVDLILYCAYGFAAITLAVVFLGVVVISGINSPMSLLKLLAGLVIVGVIVAGAYFLAPGSAPVGYLGEPVSDSTLKLTDTILNLTYLLCGGALLSLVVGAVMSVLKK
jgi:TRAP-type C4-dicarboxylate transport system permease small subunit